MTTIRIILFPLSHHTTKPPAQETGQPVPLDVCECDLDDPVS
jgi:hypothetical protein